MDYETKIYLDKLIAAIEKHDGPDWWIVGLTIINTLAVIAIAFLQNRIQRQQIKVQEYEVYRKLYHSIKLSNDIIDSFVVDVLNIIWPPSYHETNIDKLKKKKQDILSLHKELESSIIDFELKFSNDFFDKDKYYAILNVIMILLDNLIYLYNQNNDSWLCRNIKEEYKNEIEEIRRSKNDETIINIILEHIPEIGHKTLSKLGFESFIELKREVHNDCIIEKIRKSCKID